MKSPTLFYDQTAHDAARVHCAAASHAFAGRTIEAQAYRFLIKNRSTVKLRVSTYEILSNAAELSVFMLFY
jgi:hypothetical protein